ncbi:amidohydrolase [Flavobacterium restrictum]|uniref:Amidohydrolase n=1 Tax=Flavobacterium restrictum TaxID=2594428 RepID=A0A553ECK2_9FLAO|nr:amidohydrolase [Flavobacterium restrictum]TRX42778.1 amidohydrolase [Flavobacterium restrictum]
MKKNRIAFAALLLTTLGLQAQSSLDFKKITVLSNADGDRLVTIFKDIHANPELGFMEVRTAAIVAKELKSLGFTVMTGIGKTGVVATLKNGDGPIVMYRADMDCNAVKETTGLPYASAKMMVNPDGIEVPVAHLCGHDAHTTWMLGIAKNMVAMKNQWKGTLIMIGQPAEEPGGGAAAMEAEMYKKGVPEPDYLLGMHTAPLEVGYYLNAAGPRMAGADQFDVTFHGIGGHGSSPNLAVDPIVMAANAILQYQTIISRNNEPQAPAVITVGAVQAGIDNNVIPASATLKLNTRFFNYTVRDSILKRIERVNLGIAIANNLPKELYPTLTMKGRVSPLTNDKMMVDKIDVALEKLVGPGKNIQGFPAVMGSEDFQHLVINNKKTVYDYFLVGIASAADSAKARKEGKMFPYSNHNGDFKVDLTAIPFGVTLGTTALLEMFQK